MAKRVSKPRVEKVIARPEVTGIAIPAPVPMSDVLGQERAVEVLQSALRSERVHHAWIFHGPTGVGKFTLALSFAATLLDPTSSGGLSGFVEPEVGSRTQQLLQAGTHPDLQIVVKELAKFHHDSQVRDRKLLNIPVEVIEKFLIEPATKSASSSNAITARAQRVFIVDEAELIRTDGQNQILKTLEEPPAGTVIILVTSQEERLLPTIRSRCQRIGLGLLPPDAMNAWMKKNASDVTGPEKEWLLEFSQGAPGVVAAARQAGLYAWHQTMLPLLQQMMKGKYILEFSAAAHQLLDTYSTTWVDDHENASKEAANRAGANWLFRIVSDVLRKQLRNAKAHSQIESTLVAIQLVRDAEMQLASNVQQAAALDSMGAEIANAFAMAELARGRA